MGTPIGQPLLRVVLADLYITVTGELKPRGPEFDHLPESSRRLKALSSKLRHLFFWRAFFGNIEFLDRILFERYYSKQKIKQPLYVVSPARSGSTTMGHILDADPSLTGPAMYFLIFPY